MKFGAAAEMWLTRKSDLMQKFGSDAEIRFRLGSVDWQKVRHQVAFELYELQPRCARQVVSFGHSGPMRSAWHVLIGGAWLETSTLKSER